MERNLIAENRLLRRLDPEDLAPLLPHLTHVELVRGNVLHRPRETMERIYFPLCGMVSLLAVMQSGDMIETSVVGREGVVGASVVNDIWQSFGQATVQIPGEALQIGARTFINALDGRGLLRTLMNKYQGVILLQAQQNAACHALHTVDARLCRWILQAQDAVGGDVVDLTQEFLSHMLGVQRTSVSLNAHALQESGLIDYSRGRIRVRDRDGIEACACECYAVIRGETDKMIPPAGDRPAVAT